MGSAKNKSSDWELPPTPTWAELLFDKQGEDRPSTLSEFRSIHNYHGILPSQLNDPCDEAYWFECWGRGESPNAEAYRLLDYLNIGSDLEVGDLIGGLKFIDGPCPGNDYLAVHADGEISASLLQHQLNVIGQNIAVKLVG